MTARFKFMLPSNNSVREVRVTESVMITLNCRGCGYEGKARRITGVSTYPIYTCPKCKRIVQMEEK